MMQDNHIFQGMRRDNHPIRQEKQFLWDAHNIRFTTRDDNTMLSITNERSNKDIMKFNSGETYIGHVVLGDYLVLFTKGDSDCIYRIDIKNCEKVILYKDNLNFSSDNPIQALGDYESEFIQKVYWVDGKNNPRVINIRKPELLGVKASDDYTDVYTDAPFDFVQNLKLDEKVTIKRLPNSNGIFSSGTIQYALTYYHKYGQESNIFYTSELLYTSFNNRGGSPEDRISTAFEITVDNVQNNFQYVRIYSISRSSIDATPKVKRVADIEILKAKSISFVDNGTTGNTVDPSMLLYIGGKDIVAGCISSKDNTLFLGNIEYRRKEVSTSELVDSARKLTVNTSHRDIDLNYNKQEEDNPSSYINQLFTNTSTFKCSETYRLGLQLQYKNGEWSEPLFIDDKLMDVRPSIDENLLQLPTFKASLTPLLNKIDTDYIKVRPLIVLPATKDKTVLAQGILCPTVFNAGNRESNAPFAQASWFMRPFISEAATMGEVPSQGAIAEFRHYWPLSSGLKRGAEIQNMFIDTDATTNDSDIKHSALSLKSVKEQVNTIGAKNESYRAFYYVDQSILTFHSPDIEFDDSLVFSINNNSNLGIRLVGVVPFNSSYGDIDIQTASPVINPDASGFIHRAISNNLNGGKSLISGLFYEDSIVDDYYDKNNLKFTGVNDPIPFLVNLWHRSGSLNNDIVRPNGSTRSSVLKKKIISNIRFSDNNKWLNNPVELDVSEIQSFNSNEVALTKIKDSHNKLGDITYYGNVDTLNTSYSKFRLVRGQTKEFEINKTPKAFSGTIFIETDSGIKETYFSNLEVTPDTGTATTMNGTVTSDYTIVLGGQISDINLKDSKFSIALEETSRPTSPYNGYITTVDGTIYAITGNTNYKPTFNLTSVIVGGKDVFRFNSELYSIDPHDSIGKEVPALKLPKDAVRIKYKSTPHLVLATKFRDNARQPLPVLRGTKLTDVEDGTYIGAVSYDDVYWQKETSGTIHYEYVDDTNISKCPSAYLWLAEVIQTNIKNRYGGDTDEALRNNLWIPAGPAIRLDGRDNIIDGVPTPKELEWYWGDTWYQRYDCLKTYPFTPEDENQVVEIGSFMCETRVNADGRYDRNRGAISNLNMSPTNFNLFNPVYSQHNTFFNYRILDADYYSINKYPSQLLWTGAKSPSSIQDIWTNLHMANTLDLDGANGELVAIKSFNDLLLGFQETGLQNILFNSRVQIQASDGIPIEIANSQKVEGARTLSSSVGCQDKFSIIETPRGIYFIDNNRNSMYLFNGKLQNIGLKLGSLYWFRDNHGDVTWRFKYNGVGKNGIRLFYDDKYEDIYFTPGKDANNIREALCYSEQLDQFTSFMSYGGSILFSHESDFYALADNEEGILTLYKNFAGKGYNNIFGIPRPFSLSFISNDNPAITKIFDTIEMRADCYIPNYNRDNNFGLIEDDSDSSRIKQVGKPFDTVRVDNEYQYTGEITLDDTNMRKKFRVWRALIPRKKGSRERIRNPWAKITLGMKNPDTKMTILHDLNVGYTV